MAISKAALPLSSSLLTEKVTVETMCSGFNQTERPVGVPDCSPECLLLPSNKVRGQVKPLPNDCAIKGLKEQPPVIYRQRIE